MENVLPDPALASRMMWRLPSTVSPLASVAIASQKFFWYLLNRVIAAPVRGRSALNLRLTRGPRNNCAPIDLNVLKQLRRHFQFAAPSKILPAGANDVPA